VVIIVILSHEEFSLLKMRDKTVLTKIYNHYAESLTTFFLIKTFGNPQAADDLIQETFCAVIKSAPKFKSPEILRLTIFAISRNKLVDYQRKIFRGKIYNNG
jgi:DNA-directed RNA polymerase specialized sigma24 family protein